MPSCCNHEKTVTFIDQVISRIKNNRLSFRKEVDIYQGQAVPCLFDRALLLDLNSTDNRIETDLIEFTSSSRQTMMRACHPERQSG